MWQPSSRTDLGRGQHLHPTPDTPWAALHNSTPSSCIISEFHCPHPHPGPQPSEEPSPAGGLSPSPRMPACSLARPCPTLAQLNQLLHAVPVHGARQGQAAPSPSRAEPSGGEERKRGRKQGRGGRPWEGSPPSSGSPGSSSPPPLSQRGAALEVRRPPTGQTSPGGVCVGGCSGPALPGPSPLSPQAGPWGCQSSLGCSPQPPHPGLPTLSSLIRPFLCPPPIPGPAGQSHTPVSASVVLLLLSCPTSHCGTR